MHTENTPYSRLPFVGKPVRMESDAEGFVRQVSEAAKAVADWCADEASVRRERVMTEIVLMFARAVESESQGAEHKIATGAGVGDAEPKAVIVGLRRATDELRVSRERLEQLVRSSRDATSAILTAMGILQGPSADAMEDERALYDE